MPHTTKTMKSTQSDFNVKQLEYSFAGLTYTPQALYKCIRIWEKRQNGTAYAAIGRFGK